MTDLIFEATSTIVCLVIFSWVFILSVRDRDLRSSIFSAVFVVLAAYLTCAMGNALATEIKYPCQHWRPELVEMQSNFTVEVQVCESRTK